MIEFDYKLDYKNILFKPNDTRYRIGRGEQGVLLVRPYTNDICKYWKFKTPYIAQKSAQNTLTTLLSFVWPLRISFLRPSPAESLRCCRLDLSIPRLVLPLIFWPRLVSLAPPTVRLFLGLKDAMQSVQRRNLENEFRE